ncbi:glycosyltransferase [Paraburkholderia sp. B3]|uniref:glycosyltransferase n=1 Tax=Paraburkholderia sp. B3 TaxID=3134791 RepID=UPI0039824D4E
MIENQIDCIVRFHDAKRLYELNRCVFALVGQTHRPLNIILAVQRFSEMEIAATHAALEPLLRLPNAPTLILRNWDSPTPTDARTELLNMGLRSATGQYVAFLDYDDVLYPEAYAVLVDRLKTSRSAIAFASVRVVNADVHQQFIRITRQVDAPFAGEDLKDLFRANFCPIHSYLIDRSIVSPDILSFDTVLTWEEDYDLLLKICASYPSDFQAIGKIIGDYYFKTDGSNSVPTNGILSEERQLIYERVTALIEVRRRTTLVAPEVQAQLGLDVCATTMTIRGALDALLVGSSN